MTHAAPVKARTEPIVRTAVLASLSRSVGICVTHTASKEATLRTLLPVLSVIVVVGRVAGQFHQTARAAKMGGFSIGGPTAANFPVQKNARMKIQWTTSVVTVQKDVTHVQGLHHAVPAKLGTFSMKLEGRVFNASQKRAIFWRIIFVKNVHQGVRVAQAALHVLNALKIKFLAKREYVLIHAPLKSTFTMIIPAKALALKKPIKW